MEGIQVAIIIGVQVVSFAFFAGITWQKINTLSKIVTNGLSRKVEDNSENLAAIEERCRSHTGWIQRIDERLNALRGRSDK